MGKVPGVNWLNLLITFGVTSQTKTASAKSAESRRARNPEGREIPDTARSRRAEQLAATTTGPNGDQRGVDSQRGWLFRSRRR